MQNQNVQPAVPSTDTAENKGFRALVEFRATKIDNNDNYHFVVRGTVDGTGNTQIVSDILANPTDFSDPATAKFIRDVEKEVYWPTFSARLLLNTRAMLISADDLFENYSRDVIVVADSDFRNMEVVHSIDDSVFADVGIAVSNFSGILEEVVSLPVTISAYLRLTQLFATEPLLSNKSLVDFTESSIHELEKALKEEKEASDREEN